MPIALRTLCIMHTTMGTTADEVGRRIRHARLARGYATATETARRLGMNIYTYSQYENGTRRPTLPTLERIAKTFRVSYEWLATGLGEGGTTVQMTVPVTGTIGAWGTVTFADNLGDLDAPPDATAATAALLTGADAMPTFVDGNYSYFYERPHKPNTKVPDQILGRLCVVALKDKRVIVRRIERGSRAGRYHLVGRAAEPLFDQPIEWCALVTWIQPRA